MNRQIQKTCPQCGKTYSNYPSRIKQYCSQACRLAAVRVTSECPQCGKSFTWVKSWPRKYCSNTCKGKANVSNIQKFAPSTYTATCEQCGKQYETTPARSRGRFCSHQCHGKWMSTNWRGEANPVYAQVDRLCIQCGQPFKTKPSEVKSGGAKFCGRACKAQWQKAHPLKHKPPIMRGATNANWKGGYKSYYGPNWRPQARAARRRDNHTCQHCGKTQQQIGRKLDVHHIAPFRVFGIAQYKEANRLSNLVSLCVACHRTIEHHPELLYPARPFE